VKAFKLQNHISFENDNYLGINKPSGISSLHERVADGTSIIERLQSRFPDYQLCHRIDKETSGLLLIAKNAEAYRNASIQFEKRKVKKVYHAIVVGFHQFDELKLELPLVTTRSGRSSVNSLKGKMSTTVLTTMEQFGHYTLVKAEPLTGRLHQIRIHLASQNAPIAADTVYGGKMPYLSELKRNFSISKSKTESPMIHRVALHASQLTFNDLDGTVLNIKAEYPKDFEVFLKLLRKYDASTYTL
jgi:23S rRNA pseudouridine955/2504/2580 synthase